MFMFVLLKYGDIIFLGGMLLLIIQVKLACVYFIGVSKARVIV